MKNIRIFISSPSDVQFERNVARNVIDELNVLYSKYAKLEVLMWEDFPLSANSTFQEGINYFITNKPIDISVFILWSRLGTPLCSKFLKDDGTPYKSGTEYEFDLMMKLHEINNRPHRILTYVKQDESYSSAQTLSELQELLSQKDRLDAFLKEYFHDEETNSNYAYLNFGKNTSFEQVFRIHLTNAIKEIVGEIDGLKEWEGNPYVGLNSFEYNQASIFFGRRHLIYDTATKVMLFTENTVSMKSLFVLGESGSGKSSFVKAGLLPFIYNKNETSGEYVIVTPSQFSGQMYQGLLDILTSKMPFLLNHPFIDDIRKNITKDTNFKYLSYAFEQNEAKTLIIYIDQFEELFSDNIILEEERIKILLLLHGLTKMNKIAVFMSMRSDFYNRFSMYEEMTHIKNECEVIDLPVMGISEISEIIDQPARKACLAWEIDDKGISLNQKIIKDAIAIKDLPLIEFALSELYDARNDKDMLTYHAYESIGGLHGAIVNYADRCYSLLEDKEKAVFDDILGFVITESDVYKDTYVRKTSLICDVEKTPLHKSVVNKMLNARLFVTGKDNQGRPTLTITHEVLLKSWSKVAQWIEDEKEFLSSSRHYEQMALHWVNNGKMKKDLVSGRSPLLEAEYYHFKNHKRISNIVQEFLEASIRKDKRSGLVWRIIAFVSLLFAFLMLLLFKITGEVLDLALIDQFSILDILISYGVFLGLLLYSIIHRLNYQPEYKTIKRTLVIWGVSTFLLGVYSLISANYELLVYSVLCAMYLCSEAFEYVRRNKWQNKYVPYSIKDEFWVQFRAVFVSFVVLVLILSTSLAYAISLDEKNEAMERRALVADELFDGLDNLRDQLSYTDNKYVNEMRQDYLIENFREELGDTIYDRREFEYARVMYNLKNPLLALAYLYPDHDYTHHLFYVISAYAAGSYDIAEIALELYVADNRYDQINNNISSANLIWIAEVLGRFDCAEKLNNIVTDTLSTYALNPGVILNNAHIYLANGEMDYACELYSTALDSAEKLGHLDDDGNVALLNNLKTDLHIFSRFAAIPDEILQEVADMMKVEFVPAYIPKTQIDSTLTEDVFERMHGDWECQQDTYLIKLNVDSEYRLLTYTIFDTNGTESAKLVSEVRFAQDGDTILMDEFEPTIDSNSFGRLLNIEEDNFLLEIIDNGNPADRGQQRRYVRVISE